MISIIIPTYNGVELLTKYSLPSLKRQNQTDWEALIINDGSSDDTVEVIKKLASHDERLRLLDQKENLGLAAALNLGIKESRGKFIAILEHDDIWLPNKLTQQLEALEHGTKVSSTSAIIYDQTKSSFGKINGGNFSCLMLTRDAADLIFPLPEENKKYLGIEDGLIAARLAILKNSGQIKPAEFKHQNEILTIMNSGATTLSRFKNSTIMKARYKNAYDLFSSQKGECPEIDALLRFWKKHYYYNAILDRLPNYIKNLIYLLTDNLKIIKNRKSLKTFCASEEYKKLKTYRALFN